MQSRASRAPVLAFCDADCRPEPEWLEQGLAALEETDIAAGRIRFDVSDPRTMWTLLDMEAAKDHEREVLRGTAETANLFLRRELYDRVGGFDDSIPEHGDFDFVQRCIAAGAALSYAPDAIVWHPTRDRAKSFLRAIWIYNRWYAAREARAGRTPEGLRLRSWVPLVQPYRARRRWRLSFGPDRRWLGLNGVSPNRREYAACVAAHLRLPAVLLGRGSGPWLVRRAAASLTSRCDPDRVELLLVCSSGGHLLQLHALADAWRPFVRCWVSFDKSDVRSLLADERLIFAHRANEPKPQEPVQESVARVLRRSANASEGDSHDGCRASPSRSPGSAGSLARAWSTSRA